MLFSECKKQGRVLVERGHALYHLEVASTIVAYSCLRGGDHPHIAGQSGVALRSYFNDFTVIEEEK